MPNIKSSICAIILTGSLITSSLAQPLTSISNEKINRNLGAGIQTETQALSEPLSFFRNSNSDVFLRLFDWFLTPIIKPAYAGASGYAGPSLLSPFKLFASQRARHSPVPRRSFSHGSKLPQEKLQNGLQKFLLNFKRLVIKHLKWTALLIGVGILLSIQTIFNHSQSIQPLQTLKVPPLIQTQTPEFLPPLYPLDPDANRADKMRSRLLAFLKTQLKNPSTQMRFEKTNSLYQIMADYYAAAKEEDGIVVTRTKLGQRSAVICSSGFLANGKPIVFINSLYFEPLFKLAEKDPFYARLILFFIEKEGRIFKLSLIDRINYFALSGRAIAYEQFPYIPNTTIQWDALKTVVASLDQGEIMGLQSGLELLEAEDIHRITLYAHHSTDPLITEIEGSLILLLDLTEDRPPEEQYHRLLVRGVISELPTSYPKLMNLVRRDLLKSMQLDQHGFPIPSQEVFGWLWSSKFNILESGVPLLIPLGIQLNPQTKKPLLASA